MAKKQLAPTEAVVPTSIHGPNREASSGLLHFVLIKFTSRWCVPRSPQPFPDDPLRRRDETMKGATRYQFGDLLSVLPVCECGGRSTEPNRPITRDFSLVFRQAARRTR